MIHFGDITKINGSDAPVVDVIIGGSPCQDLSIAGNRAGLAGERSSLYMEQIRIIKEMRREDERKGRTGIFVRPRFMVWENVPGAFSSNGGKDFGAVLEEAIRVKEPEAPDVPVPEKGWPTSGAICDEMGTWSIAWRVLDAQFWGVPQRRRRIALVADFGGLSAPEILFVRKSVSGDSEQSEQARQETAGDSGEGTVGAGTVALEGNGSRPSHRGDGYVVSDKSYTLNTTEVHGVAYSIENHPADSRVDIDDTGKVQTLTSRMGTGGGNVPMVMEPVAYNGANITSPVNVTNPQPGDPCHTISTDSRNYVCMDVGFFNSVQECRTALLARGYKDPHLVCGSSRIVRRLTPLECERLQGFPDGWTDIGEWIDSKGKKHKEADSPRYKALGNSIAIPPWKWVLKRLCACYERDATMASLFDGIGGFPYIWEQLNGKGSCLWASEIEEFPIAVTKLRFGGNDYGIENQT